MAQLARTWLGLGAIGAGLIHLAVAASSAPALLMLFLAIGAAETAWGVAAMARRSLALPRTAMAGALLTVVVWIITLQATPMRMSTSSTMVMTPVLPTGAMLGAGALDLLIAVGIALVRRGARASADQTEAPPSALRFLVGTIIGAGVVAVVTANCLAATPIGASVMPGMDDAPGVPWMSDMPGM